MRISGLTFMIGCYAIVIALVLTFKVFLIGSLITSTTKAISDDCGKTYGVEALPIIFGNWFCSSNPKKKVDIQ